MAADEFPTIVNRGLQNLGIAYEVKRKAKSDGDCFYDSAFAVAFEDHVMREKLSDRTRGVTDTKSLRVELARFMKTNHQLHALSEFQSCKDFTLKDDRNKGLIPWEKYLKRMATTKEYADQLTVMCMALFCGKDIQHVNVQGTRKGDDPWWKTPGTLEGWPYPVKGQPIRLAYLHKSQHYEPLQLMQPPSIRQARQTRSPQPRPPTTPTKPSFTQPKSPAKRKGPPTGRGTKPKSPMKVDQPPIGSSNARTRSMKHQITEPQAFASSQPKSPTKPDQVCKGCGYIGSALLSHLGHKPRCQAWYDMVALRAESAKRRFELMAARNREKYHNDPDVSPRKKANMTAYNEKHREDINREMKATMRKKYDDPDEREKKKEAMREKYNDPDEGEKKKAAVQTYYQRNRERILTRMALQRKAKFDNKTDYDRFMDFKNAMKNVCAYGCICCHTILSNTKDCRVAGGIKGLEKELGDLFEKCILNKDKLPKELKDAKDVYLCNTCRRWLKQYKEMPPKCYNNGLGVDPIPPGLKELDDLGMILISKGILFIKLYHTPVSRWHLSKDHAVHVPIDEETLLKTLNKVTSFPRLPEEAGIIPVDLKRKREYKNSHEQFYIQPQKLIRGLEELVESHPSYKDITIDNRYPVPPEDLPDMDTSEMEEEDETMDCVRRNQLNEGGATMLINANLKTDVLTNLPGGVENPEQQRIAIAPGEGKLPTSLTRDNDWDIDSLPKLYPRGRFGLNWIRIKSQRKSLTVQDFVCQRFQNIDPRWRNCPTALFAYLYCIERLSLEKAMSIAYRRGKVGKNGQLTNLEDACCIFSNQPGTDQYWQTKRYEVLAKQDQLGPFQIFFTLSCADKRWDENFVAILQQRGLTIHYRPPKEQPDKSSKYSYQADDIFIFVEEDGKEKPLRDFLNENVDLHKTVKENVLTVTMMFDKRVKEFINKLVMAPSNPMKVRYYHYRVEFQKRGAGHIHGVLWLDLDELEKTFKGLTTAMKKFKTQEPLTKKEKDVVAAFVDSCSTCDLKDEDLTETVIEVQKHSHRGNQEKKTGCFKKGSTCRFNFPRLPSERTIIAQPLKQGDMTDKEYAARKKEHKENLQRVKEKLVQLTEDGRQECSLDTETLLQRANVDKKKYYEALEVSQSGACIILKRDPKEAYINNYNPEWMKAWDGNMDISVCLDYFAIVTYITDYYTKTESGVTKAINAAVKASKERGDDMTATMSHLVYAYLKSREMGESEAYYRIIPSLHLSQSNVKCTFVATGFPENRSTMLRPVNERTINQDIEDEADADDDFEEKREKGDIQIAGSDKIFRKICQIHEKYANRPKSLEAMCLAQFVISYDMMDKADGKKKKYQKDGSTAERSKRRDMNIVSYNPEEEKPLPLNIKLDNDLGYMRLRERGGQSVLRRHKLKEDKSPHEYYYSQLVLFWPWRKEEEELRRDNLEECRQLFEDMEPCEEGKDEPMRRTKVEKIQEKLFPHLNDVEEGRAVVAQLDDHRPTHIGDMIDPQSTLENEEAQEEGMTEDGAHAGRFPNKSIRNLHESMLPSTSGRYRMIPLPKNDNEYAQMRAAAGSLDDDQRMVLDIQLNWAWEDRSSILGHTPDPPLLIVHGGAGTGKSHLINTMATICEYYLRLKSNMSDTRFPAVIKMAPTGIAANGIDGQTLHQAFKLPWGNQYTSLTEKVMTEVRSELRYLSIIIIDEMSMVKADQLYQLHQRLQDIKGNKLPFGGISIVLCGDLLQLPPVQAAQIFEAPLGEKYRQYHEMTLLWDKFKIIELTHNHRQAGDWDYAEMLNRIRWNKHTEEDLKTLASRISDASPADAVYVYGKNAPCKKHNDAMLEGLCGEMHSFMAHHPKGKNFVRVGPDSGKVGNTAFLDKLCLKVGAKVMLIHNVDTSDYLSNGSSGYVVGFEWSGGKSPEITKILVQFDDPRAGAKVRARHPRHPMFPEATPISRVSFEYNLGKIVKRHAAKSKVIQFPMDLAWAITAHKCQGMTIKPPKKLVADLDSIFETWDKRTQKKEPAPGMAYVMLGRVQNINQLILRWSYDPNPKPDAESERKRLQNNEKAARKIKANAEALEEALKLKKKALNNPKNRNKNAWLKKGGLKIVSLNVQGSLQSRLSDLKKDKTIYMVSDILCLQETGPCTGRLELEGYSCINAGGGKNKGVAIYMKDGMKKDVKEQPKCIEDEFFQGLKMSCSHFDLITVYRAHGPSKSFKR